jgi:protein-S-isoprenylcysteine O-methyltransferase Ste14
LLVWSIFFVVGNAIYIPLAEGSGLVKRFSEDYLAYKRNVPRWIPRVRAWTGREPAPPYKKRQRLIDKS